MNYDYCEYILDSIIHWKENNELNPSKIDFVWNDLPKKLSKSLDLSQQQVKSLFSEIKINNNNWTTVYPDKYLELPFNTRALIDEIENSFLENVNVNDESLIAIFEKVKDNWKTKVDPFVLHNTIEVSKSSFVFWRKNFHAVDKEVILTRSSPQTSTSERPTRWRALAKLAVGDATGAAWGSIGGPGGALVGGVGGTLGATISGSIFGFD